ncbi:hypothetical protein [Streptomyces goshikiensis]|uniref:hypothetical protein n=1 Tax=Streptomyces goshikiensis TaxID=1942 RepID=UPI0036C88E13
MYEPVFDKTQPPSGSPAAVAVSTLCATALTAAGTPIAHALLLEAGAGIAGPFSGRLSTGRPMREVVKNLLDSPG